jgi:PAS domain S-box-containing protein
MLVIATVAVGSSVISTEIDRRQWIEHSYAVIRALDAVVNDITDAESGQRGFVSTGDAHFLDRYKAANNRIPGDLDALQALISDNPLQTDKLLELRRLIAAKTRDMDEIIRLGEQNDWTKLRMFVRPGTGLHLIDQIRIAWIDMNAREFQLLRERTDSVLHLNRWLLPVAGAAIAIAGLVLMIALHLNRQEKGRRAAVEDAFRRSEARFQVLVDRVSDYAILMLDPDGLIMSWNAGAERLNGYSPEEALGRHFSMLYTPEDLTLGKTGTELATALANGSCEDEGWRIRKDGSRFWASVSITAIRDDAGTLLGFAKVSRDLTDRKRAENALHDAKELAEASTRAKSTFLATMSHELRTPMTGVLGMIELLQTNPPEEQKQLFLDTLRNSATSLMTVLGDILDLSKIEADRIELEALDFNIHDLLSSIVELFMPQASSKGLTLRFSAPFTRDRGFVHGDPTRLRQVVSNLISNAIKFTHYGQVDVRVAAPQRGDARHSWRIEVADTGIGMSESERERVFESFSQADASMTRRFGGTGLGLTISKRITELMGGEIGVEATPGQGSTFWICVPLEPGAAESVPAEAPDEQLDLAPMARSLRILVAEDNPVNQLLCSYMLQQMGHEVTSVGNGREAVEALEQTPYDLVLMDMQMPEMDGPEATRHIRQMAGSISAVPIIGLTADVTIDNRVRYQESGLTSFITKPIDPRRLRAEIENLIAVAS